ncbi:MAG: hypothetical protein RIC55_15040 [Pirellulaceae bacterium]
MARLFRLWQKKRGDRRTGSNAAGSLGEALFFAVLFLLGAVALAAVLTSQLSEAPHLSGWSLWLVLLVLASFLLIGGAGFVLSLLHFGASAERRSALIRRAGSMELIGDGVASSPGYPSVPRDVDLTDSPGTVLEYRLPVVQSPVWRVAASAVFCLLWNAATAVLIVLALESYVRDEFDWLMATLAGVMFVVGGWSIYHFVRQLFDHTGVGPTSVEISDLPLRPGQRYEVFLAQAGQMSIDSLQVMLVCEEEATFSQGTDVRTETRRVHCACVLEEPAFTVEPGMPYERRCELIVPAAAMHSFRAAHNAIHWKLIVRGQPRRRTAFERTFPVIVYPPARVATSA